MGCPQRKTMSFNHVVFSQVASVKCPIQEREKCPVPPLACPAGPPWGMSREGVPDQWVSLHFCDPGFSLCLFTKGPGNTKPSKPSAVPPGPPVYLDLCYIPNHSNSKNVDVEFFKRVRSSYYVVSGNDPAAEEPSRAVLDALLEGKAQWGSNMQVRALDSICTAHGAVSRGRGKELCLSHKVPHGSVTHEISGGRSGFHTKETI